MNERIQELYLHAFAPSISDSAVCEEGAKKFAELIVQECIEIIEPCKCGCTDGAPESLICENIIKQIKGHFGVE